eukprot:Hpha_TRINITY_DN24176_c0_g1::TRINITY_DN24176_c0_g1_i1::g.9872::m.9872
MGNKQGREERRNSDPAAPRWQGKPLPGAASAACSRRSIAHRDLRSLDGAIWENELALLRTLDASYNKLGDGCLFELENCESLEALILDHNRFQNPSLPHLPKLRFLSLASNRVTELEELLCSLRASAPELRTLSLLSNPCCPDFEVQARQPHRYLAYRLFVVGHLPKLGRLDLQEVTDEEREAADDLLSRISQGLTSLELELSDAPRRRPRTESITSNPRRKKKEAPADEGGSQERQRASRKGKKKKDKKERRSSRESKSKAVHADPVPEIADAEVAKAAEQVEEVEVADTVSGSNGESTSQRSESQSQPLPQLHQLLRQASDWVEHPPPPPPPPVWSEDEEGEERVRKPRAKVRQEGDWSDDSSESSSDAELERVLEKATSRKWVTELASPPPPPP